MSVSKEPDGKDPPIDAMMSETDEVSVEFVEDVDRSLDASGGKQDARKRKRNKSSRKAVSNAYERTDSKKLHSKRLPMAVEAKCPDRAMAKRWRDVLAKNGSVTCPIEGCQRRYQSFVGLKLHYEWCNAGSQDDTTRFRCDVCSAEFNLQWTLKRHQTMVHGNSFKSEVCKIDNATDALPASSSVDPLPASSSVDPLPSTSSAVVCSDSLDANGRTDGNNDLIHSKTLRSHSKRERASADANAITSSEGPMPSDNVENQLVSEPKAVPLVKRPRGRPKRKEWLSAEDMMNPNQLASSDLNENDLSSHEPNGLNAAPLRMQLRRRLKITKSGSVSNSNEVTNSCASSEPRSIVHQMTQAESTTTDNPRSRRQSKQTRPLNAGKDRNLDVVQKTSLINETNEDPSPVSKRPRGRPRRTESSAATNTNGNCVSGVPSRSSSVESSANSVLEEATTVCLRRKPGRPKKASKLRIGRPSKISAVAKPSVDNDASLRCGVCSLEVHGRSKFDLHAFAKHNGLARPEGEEQTFTTSEKKSLLQQTINKLGRIHCRVDGCTKSFTTCLGFAYHERVCGVNLADRSFACEICGRMLIPESVSNHMRSFHPPTPPPQPREPSDGESVEAGAKRQRAAAKKALKRVTQISKDLQSENVPTVANGDEDFSLDDNAGEDEDASCDELNDDSDEVAAAANESDDELELEQMYHKPKPIRLTNEVYAKWREELQRDGGLRCANDGCMFTAHTITRGVNHHRKCGSLYTCLVCNYVCPLKRTMCRHVKAHICKSKCGDDSDQVYRTNIPEYQKKRGDSRMPIASRVHRAIKLGQFGRKFFTSHIEFATSFFRANYLNEVFPAWRTREDHWKLLCESEFEASLPACKESAHFRSVCMVSEGSPIEDLSFETLQLFDSKRHGLPNGAISCFVGGPVWACAWCPTPHHLKSCSQYVAVACHGNMNLVHNCDRSRLGPGLIQIWNVGDLEAERSTVAPGLILGICHDYGTVWSLVWCPSGCWRDPTSEGMPRLGLLAAAFSDGYIRIYSVPQPECLAGTEAPRFYAVTPTAVLSLNKSEPKNIYCTALSWLQHKGHELLAAGFTNGSVAIFDLATTSPLLRTTSEPNGTERLIAFHAFQAHGGTIMGLDFAHNQRGTHLVSVGNDRCTKFWDLRDTTVPYNVVKKYNMTSVCWMPHWCGVLSSSCDSVTVNSSGVHYNDCGYFGEVTGLLSDHNAAVWAVSPSYWLNSIVSCDAAGEVVICVMGHLMQMNGNVRDGNFRHLPLYRAEREQLDEAKLASSTKPTTYEDSVARYNILYKDEALWDLKAIPLDNLKHGTVSSNMISCPVDEFPLTSVNRVAWNPNLGSHRWIVSGEQNGMMRFVCVKDMNVVSVKEVRDGLREGFWRF